MKKTPDEIYDIRKQFFNAHAEKWLDMWYRNQATGKHDKHAKDFERLFSLLPLKAGDHVLDAGCGTGVLVPFILDRIMDSGLLYELDFAEKMIKVNRQRHAGGNVKFLLSDAEHAPLEDDCCDAVICFSCFPHFQDQQKAVNRLAEILKPGGIFAVSHFGSSEELNTMHRTFDAVMHDQLPSGEQMRGILASANLTVDRFIDESGFYCILASK